MGKSMKNTVHAQYDIISRLCQPGHEPLKKPLFLFHSCLLDFTADSQYFYFTRSSSNRSTETNVDTPFSCMVIP